MYATQPRIGLNRAGTDYRIVEPIAKGHCNIAPPVHQEPNIEDSFNWGQGFSLVRQVPCVGDAIVEVGLKKPYAHLDAFWAACAALGSGSCPPAGSSAS